MRIVNDNAFINNTPTATTENANFPVENLQDTALSTVFRTTSATAQRIEISGSNICADYLHIFNHNLTGNALIYLQGTNAGNWDSPEFSELVKPNSGVIIHDFTISPAVSWGGATFGDAVYGDDVYGVTETISSYCFDNWSLLITDPNISDIQIGYISLGEYVQGPPMAPTQKLSQKSMSTKSYSESGQVYGNERYSFIADAISFPHVTEDNRDDLLDVFADNGTTTPFVMMIWSEDFAYQESLYCVFDQKSLDFKKTGNPTFQFTISIKFKEVR